MQTLDHSIAEMYFNGCIDREEAVNRSSNPAKMEKQLTNAGKVAASNSASKVKVGRVE